MCSPCIQATQAVSLLLVLAAGHLTAAAATAADPPRGARDPGSVPVAFEGSAFLLPFYGGIADVLLERRVIAPGRTSLSGLSGGGFTSAALHLGINGTGILNFWSELIERCTKTNNNCVGSLNGHVEELVDRALPADAADRVNGGRLRVAMSQLDGSERDLNGSASWIVDTFFDTHDLKSALTSTDFIPCFTGSTTYTLFRNQPVIDGGYANGFKQLCPGGNVDSCIKIGSWYVAGEANTTCDPSRCASCGAPERQEPIPNPFINNYRYVDQMPLVDVEQRCPPEEWGAAGLPPYPLPDFVPHNQTAVDIYPGKYSPLPKWDGRELLACEWQAWSMQLPKGREQEALRVAFDYGVETANAWADEQGY